NMEAGDVDLGSFDVQRVPTFILTKENIEVGRIIETPELSLEEDLLQILNRE
ncbi:MAG: hypothetical protein JEZ03_12835, partial [Bacteroidales bacterium]|nr:hypothetical protein [Bacteroidales bacterium]